MLMMMILEGMEPPEGNFGSSPPFRSAVVTVYRLSTLWSFISASVHHEIRLGPHLWKLLGQDEGIDVKTDDIGATREKHTPMARLGY
jgi:hypothetical protein